MKMVVRQVEDVVCRYLETLSPPVQFNHQEHDETVTKYRSHGNAKEKEVDSLRKALCSGSRENGTHVIGRSTESGKDEDADRSMKNNL